MMTATREDYQVERHRLGLAAAQGDADAQCALGVMHYEGRGGPVDLAEARRLLGLCLLYTSPSPRDQRGSRMPSSA